MDKVKTYQDAQQVFNAQGFNFTVESLRYLLDHHKSFEEVASFNNAENTVILVAAASENHDKDKAIETIYSFIEKGICIQLLHYLLKDLAREQCFFMNLANMEIIEEISKTSDTLANQDIVQIISEEIMKARQDLKEND